jgi:hypothetical protein
MRLKPHSNRHKLERAFLSFIRVDGKELDSGTSYEVTNVRERACRFLLGGFFWVAGTYRTATYKHSRATKRGAYRALKRRLKDARRQRV